MKTTLKTNITSLISSHYSKDFWKRKETLFSYFSFHIKCIFFGQTFSGSLEGNVWCIQSEAIQPLEEPVFIVFIYYNDMYTSFFAFALLDAQTFYIEMARVFKWTLAVLNLKSAHWMFFYSAELFEVVVFIDCVGLNYNVSTVASPAVTQVLSLLLFAW